MFEDNKLAQGEGTAVRLGRRFGDGMKSVPLLLELSDVVEVQTDTAPRPRAFAIMSIVLIAITGLVASLFVIKQADSLDSARVMPSVPMSARSEDRRNKDIVFERAEPDQRSAPSLVANAISRDVERKPSRTRYRSSQHRRLAKKIYAGTSGQHSKYQQEKSPAIEPYRNGMIAKPLSGKALRLALIEDRRLTREMNKATLREIRTTMQVN